MRFCHHLFWLLLSILWLGESVIGSDLQIVYDELATLTRITNAIALEAAAIRKSVKVRDVIVELLQVDEKNFTELINYEQGGLTSAMKGLFEETEKLRKGTTDQDWKSIKSGRPLLEAVRDSEAQYREFDEVKAQDFLDYVIGNNFMSEVIQEITCNEFIMKWFLDFGRLNSASSDKDSKFSAFKNAPEDDITDCLTSLQDHQPDVNPYYNNKKMFENLDPKIPLFKSTGFLASLEKVFQLTQGIWQKPNQNTGNLFNDAIDQLTKMINTKARREITLTLGFPGHGDMAKVSADLDSKWFKEKVAQGKSVEELRNGLKGFFKFGDLMKPVEEHWNLFRDGFQQAKTRAFKIGLNMKNLDNFKDGAKGSKVFADSKKALSACPAPTNNITKPLMMIKDLLKNVDDLEEKAQIDSEELMKEVKILQVFSIDNAISDLKNNPTDYKNFKKLLEKFEKNQKALANLKTLILKLKSESMQGSSYQYLKCLKANLFDSKPLLEILSFVTNARQLMEPIIQQTVSTLLNNFVQLRNKVFEAEKFVQDIGPKYRKEHHAPGNPILKLEHSQELVLSLGRGCYVLRDMTRALELKDTLIASTNFPENFNARIQQKTKNAFVKKFWPQRKSHMDKLIDDLQNLDEFASTVKDKGLLTMRKILDEAIKVQGFPEVFRNILGTFPVKGKEEKHMDVIKELSEMDMNFASHKGYLHAASLSFDELRMYIDDIFGLNKEPQQEIEHSYLTSILICVSIFLMLIIGILLFCGLTKSGRRRIRNLYFYYFGKPEDFEKRWRYSLFMDRQEGKNALLDAAREINATNVLKAVKKGAYINAFNQYGNTALHVATKRGYPEIVEILIKNGADRTLFNARNKTAEQLIPSNWRTSTTTQTGLEGNEKFEEVEKIFKKHQKKKYRMRVPEVFPSTSFHIYVDERADETVATDFMKKFQAITSNEALPTTTHYIVRTDAEGILDLDSLELLVWIISGVIIVKDTWMVDCLKDEKLIEKDSLYLLKMVRYRGTVYDTVIHWSESMAKFTMPYLCGVYVGVVIPDYQNLIPLATIVVTHGGVMCSKFPEKSMFNVGSRPYLHAHLGPIFIIHDGKTDVEAYRNDADKMYTLFTEEEFMHFMLKRGINVDVRTEVIPATTEPDD